MKKLLALIIFCTVFFTVIACSGNPTNYSGQSAQEQNPGDTNKQTDDSNAIHYLKKTPELCSRLGDYLSKNMVYTEEMKKSDIHGTLALSYIVEKSGEISTVKIVKSLAPAFDSAALKAIRAMPKWPPFKQDGKAIRVQWTSPISIR